MTRLFETVKFVKGLAPAADRWNTNPVTDVVNTKLYDKVCFLVTQAGGTTGTATFTVIAQSDVSATGAVAVAYRYQVGADGAGAGGDLFGAVTEVGAAGFTSTAATDRQYLIEVRADELPADKPFVSLTCTEAANDPVNGCVSIILYPSRYSQEVQPTAIA